jgi:hypothetical protein
MLERTSPTLVAEHQTALPPKALLRRKLHELYAQLAPEDSPDREHRKALPAEMTEERTSGIWH